MAYVQEKIGEFESIVGAKNVSAHKLEQKLYSRDLWPASLVAAMDEIRGVQSRSIPNDFVYAGGVSERIFHTPPQLIVWPEREEQIVQVVQLCRRYRFPIIPFGGGSGVTGGTTPIKGGIILDLKKMDKILRVNDQALTVTVQPGMNGQLFEESLNRKGYTLGHFPSSIYCSTVGGWVATRAAGQLSTLYGKIEDMVVSLRIVLGDGRIVETLDAPRMAMSADFKQLFIGSEGTLGIISEISFQVRPYPKHRLFRAVEVNSVNEGIDIMRQVMRAGLTPAATRLYDEIDTILIGSGEGKSGKNEQAAGAGATGSGASTTSGPDGAAGATTGTRDAAKDGGAGGEGGPGGGGDPLSFIKKRFAGLKEGEGMAAVLKYPRIINSLISAGSYLPFMKCLLVFTFEGDKGLNKAQNKILSDIIRSNGVTDLGPGPAQNWWNHRYNVSYNTPPVYKSGSFVDTCEVATDWSRLPRLYHRVKDAVSGDAFIMAHFSHSYLTGGNIYFSIVGTGKNRADLMKKYFRIWEKLMKICISEKAALSHHHGIGHLKGVYLKEQLGGLFPILEAVKKQVDPDNILNPGKLGLPLEP